MSPEQLVKQAWVEGPLTYALKTAERIDVRRLRYRVSGSRERVEVEFDNGCSEAVDVTGNSHMAILADVLKVV